MDSSRPAWRKFLKRHAEAIFIFCFLLADCFLSGWALTAATIAVVLYVFVPAIRTAWTLTAKERITYTKAFVKTAKVQRLAFLLFWIYSVRLLIASTTDACLFTLLDPEKEHTGSILNTVIAGAHQWAPLSFLATPFIFYAIACTIALLLRARLKVTKEDPDLSRQRQRWSGSSHMLFLSAFIAGILSITLNASGPGYMLSNWLLASARDANIFSGGCSPNPDPEPAVLSTYIPSTPVDTHYIPATPVPEAKEIRRVTAPATVLPERPAPVFMSPPLQYDGEVAPMLNGVEPYVPLEAFVYDFDAFVLSSCSLAFFVLLLQPALRLNAFLTSFCWRVVSPKSLQNIVEGFLEALRLPTRTLTFKESHPVWNNAVRTLVWLVTCFLCLFWLFGFCGGPLGYAIQNWMMVSVVDAGFATPDDVPAWVFGSNLRIFLGSIVALYGTAPIAVSAAVLLPHAKARKISLNNDGILFAQGPWLSLWGRQFRLWSDFRSITVREPAKPSQKPTFTLRFRSGGQVSFNSSQIPVQDLKVLLECVDQHAFACEVSPEVYRVCKALQETNVENEAAASDGGIDTSISKPAQEFKSTIFVPFGPGDTLPESQIRIIKQLSSKPLCAVYLGRHQDGRMVTVKQFYLPDETEETKALAKILKREYDLLTRLDHPGIAKVVTSYTVEQSTYLVIEHRLGVDLRAAVDEHGPRSEGLTVAWAKQLCEIMIYLHGCDPPVLHRDLTPDNVIAGEDGQLRLIDFGAAREFLDGITGTMIGKHCYIAPEQLRGEANPRSDIYSFGGTLYFLLTGRDPIALSQSSPSKNIDCSDEFDRLIRDCTEFDEQKRPQSFSEILTRLNELNKGVRLKVPASKEKALA